jgi:hypothetical protein
MKHVDTKKFVTMVTQHAQFHSFLLITTLLILPHIHSIYDNILWKTSKSLQKYENPGLPKYCYEFMAPWLIITGFWNG